MQTETVARPISAGRKEMTAMDRRLTTEDLDWLRKLSKAKAANQPSPDIPTNVVRRLTMLACAEVRSQGKYSITLRGCDELVDRELEDEVR